MATATEPFTTRLDRARGAMGAAGIDALLLTPGADLQYLTGLGDIHAGERLAALLLGREGKALWICPAMNAAQVEAHSGGVRDIRTWTDTTGYLPLLKAATEELGLTGRRVGVDEEM